MKGAALRVEVRCMLRRTLLAEEKHRLFFAGSEVPRNFLFSGEDKLFQCF